MLGELEEFGRENTWSAEWLTLFGAMLLHGSEAGWSRMVTIGAGATSSWWGGQARFCPLNGKLRATRRDHGAPLEATEGRWDGPWVTV
jgi:hypothetical protein